MAAQSIATVSEARAALEQYTLSGVEETGRELGVGAFCLVVEVSYNGKKYAAKHIHKVLFNSVGKQGRIISEIDLHVHNQLDHPNIVRFIGVYFPSPDALPGLVMEALPTTLATYLDDHGAPPNEVTYSILQDVALGLQYLHNRPEPIMHRDLSSNNILLTDDLHAKIGDFGVSRTLPPASQPRPLTPAPGSPSYMPPEALVEDPHYGTEIDIFSFGVMILHVCTAGWPIPTDAFTLNPSNPLEIIPMSEVERRQEYFDQMGPNHPLRSLAMKCLSNRPANRPTATGIVLELNTVKPGLEDSQRLFKEAMKHGYVKANLALLLLIGAAGAGKTCSKNLFLGLPPPPVRQSTRLAEETVRAISTLRAMVSGESTFVWDLVTLEDLEKLIAEGVKTGLLQEHSIPPLQQPARVSEPAGSARPSNVTPQSSKIQDRGHQVSPPDLSQEASPVVVRSKPQIERNIVELIESSSESRKFLDVSWVYVVDSGGQSSFREIASLFLRNASAVCFVTKLNEQLCEKPTVEWYDKDGKRWSASTSHLTNLEILRHSVRGMHSRQCVAGGARPKVLVVGTYRDLEHTCKETRTKKNAALLDVFQLNKEDLEYYNLGDPDELIFPVNAKNPTVEDQKVAEQFRRTVSKCGQTVQVPIPWFIFDNYLHQRADALRRKILRTSECEEEAEKLHMNPEACESALEYLDKINMLFYCPEYLKGLVFCGAQVWLDKISELIECIYKLHGESSVGPTVNAPQPHSNGEFSSPAPADPIAAEGVTPSNLASRGYNRRWRAIKARISSWFCANPQPQNYEGTLPIPLSGLSAASGEDTTAAHDGDSAPHHLDGATADEDITSSDNEASSPDIAFPDLTEFYNHEGTRFRDYGIVTINILKKFPSHYVEGLFTPTEFLELLTAFLVTAPVSERSDEYIMPCLLRELSPQELDKHRHLSSSSPASPLLIRFADNWVPAGIFVVLITYLHKMAGWKLRLTSGKPHCLRRNCVTFKLPTGGGGFVTLIDAFEYLEVHVSNATPNACQNACRRIRSDIFKGIVEAATRLHYGALSLQPAFPCPNTSPYCPRIHHLANPVDGELVCSKCEVKTGEVSERHKIWDLNKSKKDNRCEKLLSTNDFSAVYSAVYNAKIKWSVLGTELGLSRMEVVDIEAENTGRDCHAKCLQIMLEKWLQRCSLAPSWQKLVSALKSEVVGKEEVACEIERKYVHRL